MNVNARLIQYTDGACGSPPEKGSSSAIVAPERRDLGEREIDEDDPPLDHVHAEVGVNAGQDQAGRERRGEELQDDDESIAHLRSRSA